MKRFAAIWMALSSGLVFAVPPVWNRNFIEVDACDRMFMYIRFAEYVVDPDSTKFTFRSSNAPAFGTLDPHFGDYSGTPSPADWGSYSFTVEASDNAGATWVPVQVRLNVTPRPELICKDGSAAKVVGLTSDRKFELYTCKNPSVRP